MFRLFKTHLYAFSLNKGHSQYVIGVEGGGERVPSWAVEKNAIKYR